MIEQQLYEIRAMLLNLNRKNQATSNDKPQDHNFDQEENSYLRLNKVFKHCTEINEEMIHAVRQLRGGDFDSIFNDPNFSIDEKKQDVKDIDSSFLKKPKRNKMILEQKQKKKTTQRKDEEKETNLKMSDEFFELPRSSVEKNVISYFIDDIDDIHYSTKSFNDKNGSNFESVPETKSSSKEEDSIVSQEENNTVNDGVIDLKEDYSSELENDERPSQIFNSPKFHFVELDNSGNATQQSTNQYEFMDSITRLPNIQKE